ncbi:MAG: bifunctional phosphoribosylaminoimidazolecarboxamide formyltransferase/IMP cyclohydrolase [Bacteroidales bacterium]|nr:bifunctional phosphoribosylaminoimidazolecarboxamide formyltransferase/IMP cyclohydrolase [Bacteroidales bacterium]
MSTNKKIRSALVSVFNKEKLESIVSKLNEFGVRLYSTGGTKDFIEKQGIEVTSVESLTDYPSILGGRVKTLHPKVFGGILSRRENNDDRSQLDQYGIPEIDLVIVDLYPFEVTLTSGASEQEIIEKIDIGGISLIRAAAKNYKDVLVVSSRDQYDQLLELLTNANGETTIEQRKLFAKEAFNISSHYDSTIFNHFDGGAGSALKLSVQQSKELRYGENPHQEGLFFGRFESMFDQLWGREISYNNLLDIDAAVSLIGDFDKTTFAVLKHNNACGVASRENLTQAWKDALAGDPVSAFGGILVTNREIDATTADEMNKIFFEVSIAPGYDDDAIEILKQKKNRILLVQKHRKLQVKSIRTVLNGFIQQDRDTKLEMAEELRVVTKESPSDAQVNDLLFANKLVKHTKSNAIVLAKGEQLLASGVGQTSRIDALKQAIEKARGFEFDLEGAVMASDAFFPFADSVEIANKAGIIAVIQPGGSKRDQESIDYCDAHNMSMVFTGFRHFKH